MNFTLEVQERKSGKIKTAVLGIVYGAGITPVSIEAEYNTLVKIINQAGKSNIIDLKLGAKTWPVILREYQQDPLTDKISHVDFLVVDQKRPLTTVVPLVFSETPKEVREIGGKMETAATRVKVKCLPKDLPAQIMVDVSALTEIGKNILIKDLKISDAVKILDNPQDRVVSVIIPKKIQMIEAKPAEAAVEGAVPAEGQAPAEGEAAKAEEKGDKEEKK